jgi:hypothetical protein
MVRFAARGASVLAGVMLLESAALAATPIKNGLYIDKTHHVTIILAETNVVTPTVTCDGKHYVPPRGVFLKSGGRFSYSGTADKESGPRPPSPTKMKLSVSGTFKTKHLVTGKASVAGCKVNYGATYMSSHP